MIIEAVRPFKVRTKTLGSFALEIGDRLTWPDEAVRMLLEKIPEKIRVVEAQPRFQPGAWVRFASPLFGEVTARIKSVEPDNIWITNHSVLKGEGEPVKIPASWILGIQLEGNQ